MKKKKRKQISNFLERSTPSLLGRQIAAATLRKMTTILIIFCLKFRGHIPFYKVPPPKTPLCFDFRFLVTFCWICIPSMKALYYIFLKSRVMFVSLSTTLVWLCNNQFKKKKSLKNWSWVMNVTHRKKSWKNNHDFYIMVQTLIFLFYYFIYYFPLELPPFPLK